jgi:hypothetical protein
MEANPESRKGRADARRQQPAAPDPSIPFKLLALVDQVLGEQKPLLRRATWE